MENNPKLIKTWSELKECRSDTHTSEIDVDGCNGWILKNGQLVHYLSTHTFYGLNYRHSTNLLQQCGFNVSLANWDA